MKTMERKAYTAFGERDLVKWDSAKRDLAKREDTD